MKISTTASPVAPEYGQLKPSPRWFGGKSGTEFRKTVDFADAQAAFLMEQTELFRRRRFDIIMPFCFPVGKEDGWKPSPQFHALKNALARWR